MVLLLEYFPATGGLSIHGGLWGVFRLTCHFLGVTELGQVGVLSVHIKSYNLWNRTGRSLWKRPLFVGHAFYVFWLQNPIKLGKINSHIISYVIFTLYSLYVVPPEDSSGGASTPTMINETRQFYTAAVVGYVFNLPFDLWHKGQQVTFNECDETIFESKLGTLALLKLSNSSPFKLIWISFQMNVLILPPPWLWHK